MAKKLEPADKEQVGRVLASHLTQLVNLLPVYFPQFDWEGLQITVSGGPFSEEYHCVNLPAKATRWVPENRVPENGGSWFPGSAE